MHAFRLSQSLRCLGSHLPRHSHDDGLRAPVVPGRLLLSSPTGSLHAHEAPDRSVHVHPQHLHPHLQHRRHPVDAPGRSHRLPGTDKEGARRWSDTRGQACSCADTVPRRHRCSLNGADFCEQESHRAELHLRPAGHGGQGAGGQDEGRRARDHVRRQVPGDLQHLSSRRFAQRPSGQGEQHGLGLQDIAEACRVGRLEHGSGRDHCGRCRFRVPPWLL
mmetsp:Transcript_55629/g.120127  ORF Transcript_55629/g.120127 Transcript_55629/m.120127 type:complete len:219 (+) Transcript_55629:719-1375(+)